MSFFLLKEFDEIFSNHFLYMLLFMSLQIHTMVVTRFCQLFNMYLSTFLNNENRSAIYSALLLRISNCLKLRKNSSSWLPQQQNKRKKLADVDVIINQTSPNLWDVVTTLVTTTSFSSQYNQMQISLLHSIYASRDSCRLLTNS